MKLAALYNVFDGLELLEGSINCVKNDVDLFVIAYQEVSNIGEQVSYDSDYILRIVEGILTKCQIRKYEIIKYTPFESTAILDEVNKRRFALKAATLRGCTHFIHIDCDEYYHSDVFRLMKNKFIESCADGSVCKMKTYFKSPTLQLEKEEGYHVPFIHRIYPNSKIEFMQPYPYWVDPTRRLNVTNVIELEIKMHHYSWVRKDIELKARNSSAAGSIKRGTLLKDYHNPNIGPSFYVKDFDSKLIEVPNYFNIQV